MLELLFSIAFFMVGLYAIVGLQVAIYNGARNSTNIAMATSLASGALEELYISNINNLKTLDDRRRYFNQYGLEVTDPDQALYTLDWTTTALPLSTFDEITMTATWLNPGEAARITSNWTGHKISVKTNVFRKSITP